MTMNSIGQWFQDWSDACTYAKECAPDLSFVTPAAPTPALISIAVVCLLIWFVNERQIARLHKFESRTRQNADVVAPRAEGMTPAFSGGGLSFALDRRAA
jgi:hypothetical protein